MLCEQIGVLSPDHLKQQLTPKQINGWRIYHNKYGLMQDRIEVIGAIIAFIISCSIPRKSGSTAPKFENFLYSHFIDKSAQPEQSEEFMKSVAKAIVDKFEANKKKIARKPVKKPPANI